MYIHSFVLWSKPFKTVQKDRVQLFYPTIRKLFCSLVLYNCSQKFAKDCFRSGRCFTKFSWNFILIKRLIFYLMSLIYVNSYLLLVVCVCFRNSVKYFWLFLGNWPHGTMQKFIQFVLKICMRKLVLTFNFFFFSYANVVEYFFYFCS